MNKSAFPVSAGRATAHQPVTIPEAGVDQNPPHDSWSIARAADLYGVSRWGADYFSINESGNLQVETLDASGQRVQFELPKIVSGASDRGHAPPVILRFPGIVRQRIAHLQAAFNQAMVEFDYQGDYQPIYPIKVNQHAEVIDAILQAASRDQVGLESGSKAELLTVIAKASNRTRILCNGFKDTTMIELAMRGILLGRDITLVIEKLSDVELIGSAAEHFHLKPAIGLRIKLGWRGVGRWRESNGPESKFGLTAAQTVAAIDRLRDVDLLDQLTLLHFHPGSQINDVREIKAAITEATRSYVDLVRRGVPLQTIDVGGGLAIDYTGNSNQHASSMNYSIQEYANDVVSHIQVVCDQAGVAHPDLYSESGRAITAHHSVLVLPIFDWSGRENQTQSAAPAPSPAIPVFDAGTNPDLVPLAELRELRMRIHQHPPADGAGHAGERGHLLEAWHDAQNLYETAVQLFVSGHLNLDQRAQAEQDFWDICRRIHAAVNKLEFIPDDLQQLHDVVSDIYYANFSVFQSLPDSWALDQLFPVLPIHRLHEQPTRRGTIGDITCDSDGRIDKFLSSRYNQQRSLLLHELIDSEPYWVGVFLVGAYQEALSDDHNLLGKFHTVSVDCVNGETQLTLLDGSTLRDVIVHVHHDWDNLQQRLATACDTACGERRIQAAESESLKAFFESLSEHYTYLSD